MSEIEKSEFELAELIELHDSGAVIRPREYSDCVAGWGEYLESPMKTLSVSGEHYNDDATISAFRSLTGRQR